MFESIFEEHLVAFWAEVKIAILHFPFAKQTLIDLNQWIQIYFISCKFMAPQSSLQTYYEYRKLKTWNLRYVHCYLEIPYFKLSIKRKYKQTINTVENVQIWKQIVQTNLLVFSEAQLSIWTCTDMHNWKMKTKRFDTILSRMITFLTKGN